LEIANFIQQLALPADCRLLLAPECGGSHNLPLFCSQQKSNDTEYCNVDALVVKAGKVRFLLEIEESGLTPTKICGKFLTSALSTHFIHDILNNAATPLDSEVTFVQVMDAKNLRLRSKKLKQGQALDASIKRILPVGGIATYRLFFFRGVQDFQTDQTKKAEFQQVFLEACGRPLPTDSSRGSAEAPNQPLHTAARGGRTAARTGAAYEPPKPRWGNGLGWRGLRRSR
jgi:hypothetical protein